MGKTIRWFNKPNTVSRLAGRNVNPYYFKHERREVRTELHRESRHANRIRLKKGIDVEPERKTNGWITH